jgi:hypothetical protein
VYRIMLFADLVSGRGTHPDVLLAPGYPKLNCVRLYVTPS